MQIGKAPLAEPADHVVEMRDGVVVEPRLPRGDSLTQTLSLPFLEDAAGHLE
jgi:hypothetical protein